MSIVKLISCFLVAVSLIAACHNDPEKKLITKNLYANTDGDTLGKLLKDDSLKATQNTGDSIASESEEDPEENLDTVYNQYLRSYKEPIIIDSTFFIRDTMYHLHLKHYCLMDSSIKIPRQFASIYNLDSFVTHNFETEIEMVKNGKILFQRKVNKKDFEDLLRPQLKAYGALLYSGFKLFNNTVELDYSISIPLTDVGIEVGLKINENGILLDKRIM